MRSHLKNVYACIASASLVAAGGAAVHCNGKRLVTCCVLNLNGSGRLISLFYLGIWEGGLLSGLGSIILLTMLAFSRNGDGKDDATRFMYLNGFALCTGTLSQGHFLFKNE